MSLEEMHRKGPTIGMVGKAIVLIVVSFMIAGTFGFAMGYDAGRSGAPPPRLDCPQG